MGSLRNLKSKSSSRLVRKPSTSRIQLTRRSSSSTTAQQSQKQQLKKQKQKHQRALAAFAERRARRERWAVIAKDTQRIVFGDGKYVEERPFADTTSTASTSSRPSSVYFSSAHAPGPSKGLSKRTPGQGQEQGLVHVVHDIAPQIQLSRQLSTFYPHTSPSLAEWRRRPNVHSVATELDFIRSSTLTAARTLHISHPHLSYYSPHTLPTTSIAVLAFSSPKRPGGGYLHGGDEQEETLARSTSLVASLDTDAGKEFYKIHKAFSGVDGKGIYDHSMVYSPGVVVFRKDDDDTLDYSASVPTTDTRSGSWPPFKSRSQPARPSISTPISTLKSITTPTPDPSPQMATTIPPYTVNILSSTPPSYAAIHQTYLITPSTSHIFTSGIKAVLTQRLGRVLKIFEERGDSALVLGAYGCGSSEVSVEMVAGVWAELLVCGEVGSEEEGRAGEVVAGRREARFKDVFEHVVFAVPGKLFTPFKEAFTMRVLEAQVSEATRL